MWGAKAEVAPVGLTAPERGASLLSAFSPESATVTQGGPGAKCECTEAYGNLVSHTFVMSCSGELGVSEYLTDWPSNPHLKRVIEWLILSL